MKCWKCSEVYPDPYPEDGLPEQRCPNCGASQRECEDCGEPGAETCIGCDTWLCETCWPGHRALDGEACPREEVAEAIRAMPPPVEATALADSIALHAGAPDWTRHLGDGRTQRTTVWSWHTPRLGVKVVDVEGDAPEIWTDDSYRPATLAEADRLGRLLAAAQRRWEAALHGGGRERS